MKKNVLLNKTIALVQKDIEKINAELANLEENFTKRVLLAETIRMTPSERSEYLQSCEKNYAFDTREPKVRLSEKRVFLLMLQDISDEEREGVK